MRRSGINTGPRGLGGRAVERRVIRCLGVIIMAPGRGLVLVISAM